MNKSTNYTLLIICEGENTEPLYFKGIRDEILENEALWPEGITISILPEPKALELEQNNLVKHKTPRKRRQIIGLPDQVIEGSPPLKYIKKGHKELETGAYNEVWAVFDHDNHPTLQEAFELSGKEINGKKVQVAFSSKCFEHWILLHFEPNSTPFDKSECKDGNKVIHCGTDNHKDDCHGENCICGYMKASAYLDVRTKSNFSLFPILKDRISIAMQNAAWLRWQIGEMLSIYERNPYTDVDVLVKYLLQINSQIFYKSIGTNVILNGILFATTMKDDQWVLKISNVSNTTKIVREEAIKLFKFNEGLVTSERYVLEPNGLIEFDTHEYSTLDENYLLKIFRDKKTIYFMFL